MYVCKYVCMKFTIFNSRVMTSVARYLSRKSSTTILYVAAKSHWGRLPDIREVVWDSKSKKSYRYNCMYVCMYDIMYICMYVCMYHYDESRRSWGEYALFDSSSLHPHLRTYGWWMYYSMYVCMYVCRVFNLQHIFIWSDSFAVSIVHQLSQKMVAAYHNA